MRGRRRSKRRSTLVSESPPERLKLNANQSPHAGMSNTSDFVLKKEDHTLGNLLAEHLKAHPNVYMAGYKGQQACLNLGLHDTDMYHSRTSQRTGTIHQSPNRWCIVTTRGLHCSVREVDQPVAVFTSRVHARMGIETHHKHRRSREHAKWLLIREVRARV